MIKNKFVIAEELAKKQREISIAEFFERNKQILGFDSLTRAMLTSVKEGVENSIDACEEANILPDILIEIKKVEKAKDEYNIIIEDNGPGIVKKQVPLIFGKLLYGSRFHAMRQSRGQQGIGISAVVLYAQLTTGKPMTITSKISEDSLAYQVDLTIDTKKNAPEILREKTFQWSKKIGTKIEFVIQGRYVREKRQAVLEYIRSTSVINPHATITLIEPDGIKTVFKRVTDKMPAPTREIKSHPKGVELGMLMKMAKMTKYCNMKSFLKNDFSSIGNTTVKELSDISLIDEDMRPQDMTIEQVRRLFDSFKKARIRAPSVVCLSPVGELFIRKSLKSKTKGDFIITATRPPSVYSGIPFQVEAGIVYGGDLLKDQSVEIMRCANRAPLLYQQGNCVITQAIENIDWRAYGFQQRGGSGIPVGPAIISVHVASTKIPFTSESKEAIANVSEIRSEIELVLRQCARKIHAYIKRKGKLVKMQEKEEIIRKILPLIAEKSAKILGKPVVPLEPIIARIMDSIFIDDKVEYNKKQNVHLITIMITNYMVRSKKFKLKVVLLPKTKIQKFNPEPTNITNNIITWNIKNIKPKEKILLKFEITGLKKEEYTKNELYVEGIESEFVSGAKKWENEVDA